MDIRHPLRVFSLLISEVAHYSKAGCPILSDRGKWQLPLRTTHARLLLCRIWVNPMLLSHVNIFTHFYKLNALTMFNATVPWPSYMVSFPCKRPHLLVALVGMIFRKCPFADVGICCVVAALATTAVSKESSAIDLIDLIKSKSSILSIINWNTIDSFLSYNDWIGINQLQI